MGTVTIGIPSPSPPGETAYFVLRDNDPAVDGFMLSNNTSFPNGVLTDAPGAIFGGFRASYYTTYGGNLLSSLDILAAAGTYDFTGLTVFNWTILDGSFEPVGLLFQSMTIEPPAPSDLFRRGDCNEDSAENIADAVSLLSTLFPPPGGPPAPPVCSDACDANDDGLLNIADAIAILGSLFGSPPVPLPEPMGACGEDRTSDALDCASQPGC